MVSRTHHSKVKGYFGITMSVCPSVASSAHLPALSDKVSAYPSRSHSTFTPTRTVPSTSFTAVCRPTRCVPWRPGTITVHACTAGVLCSTTRSASPASLPCWISWTSLARPASLLVSLALSSTMCCPEDHRYCGGGGGFIFCFFSPFLSLCVCVLHRSVFLCMCVA